MQDEIEKKDIKPVQFWFEGRASSELAHIRGKDQAFFTSMVR